MPKSKICNRCGKRKPLDQYSKRTASQDGKQNMCKACSTEARKEWASGKGRGMDVIYKREQWARKAPVLRREILDALGNVCEHCGEDDERVLDIDHVNGGGSQQRKKMRGLQYLRYVLAHIEEFRLLCRNCNWIAHLERGAT